MLKSKECCVSREAREHYKDTLPIHLNFCCELSVNWCKIMVSRKAIAEVKANLSLSSTWISFFKHQKNPPGISLKILTSRASNRSCKLLHGEASGDKSLATRDVGKIFFPDFFDSGMSTWSQQIAHPRSWNGMMLHKLKNYSSYTWFFCFLKISLQSSLGQSITPRFLPRIRDNQ